VDVEPERPRYAIQGDADCDHADARGLGFDGGTNRYYRCPDCGAVLVEEDTLSSAGGTDDPGTVDPRLGPASTTSTTITSGTGSPQVRRRSSATSSRPGGACCTDGPGDPATSGDRSRRRPGRAGAAAGPPRKTVRTRSFGTTIRFVSATHKI
jgi:hypothetical protein